MTAIGWVLVGLGILAAWGAGATCLGIAVGKFIRNGQDGEQQ